jgi:uncharacterized membrane protein
MSRVPRPTTALRARIALVTFAADPLSGAHLPGIQDLIAVRIDPGCRYRCQAGVLPDRAGVEELFDHLAGNIGVLVEAVAVLVVTYGAAEAFLKLLGLALRPSAGHGVRKAIWRRFGTWLLLGLEFELAADIIGSVISPTWQDIGQLAAIAVIRTFLNFFLERDLEDAEPGERAAEAA